LAARLTPLLDELSRSGIQDWDPAAYGQQVSELRWGLNPAKSMPAALAVVMKVFGH
jgi:hypothetical protein